MNLSRGSTMGYEPILDDRGNVINLYNFLEEAKTKSYRVMCEAASEHGLEKAINDRVALEIEDYIDQYSAAWSEELLDTIKKLPVVRWLVRDKMRPGTTSSRRYGYEVPHGGAPVRSKCINFSQDIHAIQSAQVVGNWPVNVLSQKLASGEYLEGQAYEDCIDNCSNTTPFMEEVHLRKVISWHASVSTIRGVSYSAWSSVNHHHRRSWKRCSVMWCGTRGPQRS